MFWAHTDWYMYRIFFPLAVDTLGLLLDLIYRGFLLAVLEVESRGSRGSTTWTCLKSRPPFTIWFEQLSSVRECLVNFITKRPHMDPQPIVPGYMLSSKVYTPGHRDYLMLLCVRPTCHCLVRCSH